MNTHKLRIMFNTNSVWSTSGYAMQAYQILPMIRDEGYPLACINFYGQEGGSIDVGMLDGLNEEGKKELLKVTSNDFKLINRIKMYPRIADVWGSDAMVGHGNNFNTDVLFTLQDIWVVDPNALKQIKRWIPIVPIDMEPAPRAVIDRLRLAYRIITYSKFGHNKLKDEGIHSTYIPHTVDTDVFKPLNRQECRKELGIPQDIFLFGMVAANKDNPPRKSFQECMDAFKMFSERHPKSGMYFSTLLQQQNGFPIMDYAKFIGIQDRIWFLEPYNQMFQVNRETLCKIYNTFDVYLNPSASEGFGVGIIEAQACGIPAIVNNYTSMPELIIPESTGEIVKILAKRYVPLSSYWAIPDTRSIYDAMEKLYKADRVKIKDIARKYIVDNYDKKLIFEQSWKPFLNRLEDEIYPQKLDKK